MIGPIHDLIGLEQGGVSTSGQYELNKKEPATVAQKSRLGFLLVYWKKNVKPLDLQLDLSPTIS